MGGPRTTRLRTWLVGLTCGLLFAAGCARPAPPAQQGGGSSASKAEKARKDAEALALDAVNGAASAQAQAVPGATARRDKDIPFHVAIGPNRVEPGAKMPAVAPVPSAPKSSPRPGSATVVRERVASAVAATESEAETDALARACELVAQKLGELDPPVRYKPSAAEVKAEFLRKDSRTVRPPDANQRELLADAGITGNVVYVEYDVEVTADQVRELRSQERAGAALRVLGMLVAVALAGFLFLRADEWTKGYLTSWLAIAAVVLAGGAAAAFIFV
jgi:hypothetical protein